VFLVVPMLQLVLKGKSIFAADDSTRDILKRGFYGISQENSMLRLSIEEAMYLLDSRNAVCSSGKGELTFGALASRFWKAKKFMARYFAYKDWRDRGLVAKVPSAPYSEPVQNPLKKYPAEPQQLPHYKLTGVFFKSDLLTLVLENEQSRELYDRFWFGQYGAYKAADHGQLSKFDAYETLYLIDKGILSLENITRKELVNYVSKRHKDFLSMYAVYSDWRDKGYVIKTGFKFGTNFRVYFPGARPGTGNGKEWTHSKHVIHVFPKNSRLLISEWARVIRVAHSVRKTFILAVPGEQIPAKASIDFVLYHRHGGEAENPSNSAPKFAMLALGEEEYIGGRELAAAIAQAAKLKLDLLLAIVDRETAVTYYTVRRILLPKSDIEYYEIDWLQP